MFHDVWKVHWIAMAFYKPIPALSLLIILFLLIGVSVDSYSQEYKRADIWYFGTLAGLDFSTGEPVALYDGMLSTGGTCRGSIAMCDTNSSLLFYSQQDDIVWTTAPNKEMQIMFERLP